MSACQETGCDLTFGHDMPHRSEMLVRDELGVWVKHRAWGTWRHYLGEPEWVGANPEQPSKVEK